MNKRFRIFFSVILYFIFLTYNFSLVAEETKIQLDTEKSIQINNIIVQNNERIDTETIISYLNLKSGDPVNYKILNRKLKEMYNLGLFLDIKFRVSNNDLIVIIKENPDSIFEPQEEIYKTTNYEIYHRETNL